MPTPHCVLYTFVRQLYEEREPAGVGIVKVARVTATVPDDWHVWPDRYREQHPHLRLLEIASIEFVDERSPRWLTSV